ncbi:HNH endonuclease [Streptomyces sp. NPDC048306]|uniref:HNH endonuclease n=1 Tax=Streptomyces sp. NPDC048306 TaxID=3154502 RepID=UPI0033EBC985
MVFAHRWSLERKLGRKLSADEMARHTCDNPPCVNPDHLIPGSRSDNMMDMLQRNRRRSTVGIKQDQRHGLTPYERFMSYVDTETTPDGCHPWTGRTSYGRGKFGARKDGKRVQYVATRWLMEHVLGRELKPDEVVRHKCDNPICVRREHLEMGTAADNARDIVERGYHHNASKTHCKNGHPFDEANTYINPASGARQCRTCRSASRKEQRDEKPKKPRTPKTHCPQGHPYDEENTYVHPRTGSKHCRACNRERVRAHYQRTSSTPASA